MSEEKRPVGRPQAWSQDMADALCADLASGMSLRTACLADDRPAMSTVFKWIRTIPEFSQQYDKAKAESADALAEEILDIADDGTNDWMEARTKDGEVRMVLDKENVQRSRLRVDARKWIASKLKPKKYGDKTEVEHTGKVSLEQLIAQSGLKKGE